MRNEYQYINEVLKEQCKEVGAKEANVGERG